MKLKPNALRVQLVASLVTLIGVFTSTVRSYWSESMDISNNLLGLDEKGKSDIGMVVAIIVGVIVFSAMLPIVTDIVGSTTATGIKGTLLEYIPLFLVLGVLLGVISWALPKIQNKLSGVSFTSASSWRPTTSSMGQRGSVATTAMITAIVIVTVGVLFYPLVSDSIHNLTHKEYDNEDNHAQDTDGDGTPVADNANLTGISKTLAEQVPMFYVLALIFIAIGWALEAGKEVT